MLSDNKNNKILVVDDEEGICKLVQGILEDEGYEVEYALNVKSALKLFAEKNFDLAILDIWLSDGSDDGILLMQELLKQNSTLPIIMMSGHGTVETAVEAIKKGAYDFIEKPFKTDRLLVIVQRGLELSSLKSENKSLKSNDNNIESINLVGKSDAMLKLKASIAEATQSSRPLLICSADKKEAIKTARYVHANSSHNKASIELLDCSDLSQDKIASILTDNNGKRFVFTNTSEASVPYIKTILASSNGSSCPLIFIADSNTSSSYSLLKDFIKPIKMEIPTLSDRTDDLNELIDDLYKANDGKGKLSSKFTEDAIDWLKDYSWSGGLTQLNNFIEWLTILGITNKEAISEDDFISYFPEVESNSEVSDNGSNNILQDNFLDVPLKPAREIFEVAYLQEQLVRFNYNISKVSSFVEMERSALHRKLKSLNIATSNDTSSKNHKNKKTAKEA